MKKIILLCFSMMLVFSINAQVTWTKKVNTYTNGINNLIKGGTTGANDAGASSLEVLPSNREGYFEFTISSSGAKVIGVSHEDNDGLAESVDHGLYVSSTFIAYMKNGVFVTPLTSSVPAASSSNNVTYKIEKKDGILSFFYKTASTSYTLYHSVSALEIGDLVADVNLYFNADLINSASLTLDPITPSGDSDWLQESTNAIPTSINDNIYTNGDVRVQNGVVQFTGGGGTKSTVSGGHHFLWLPEKYALRAGASWGGEWDDPLVGYGSIAGGLNNVASGLGSFATGNGSIANGSSAVAIGANNFAYSAGSSAFALGVECYAYGRDAFAAGNNSNATGTGAVALSNAEAIGEYAIGMGQAASARGNSAIAIGNNAESNNDNAVSLGSNSRSLEQNSFTLGRFLEAREENGFVIGLGESNANRLTNSDPNSLMVGFNSTLPTLFVGNSITGSGGNQRWGKVGIGTDRPRAFLDVRYGWRNGEWSRGDYNAIFDTRSGCYDNVVLDMAGGVCNSAALIVNRGGIETFRLYANGSATANGMWLWSDKKFKSKINAIKNPLSIINQLEGKTYDMKITRDAEAEASYGFIAQEIQEVLPELVKEGTDQTLAVNYTAIIPILTEAMKAQQKQIEAKDQQIEELENTLQDLANTVNEIKNDLDRICTEGCVGLNIEKENAEETLNIPTYLRTAWLGQNYPNPHSGATSIQYFVPEGAERAELRVVDLQGKLILTQTLDISLGDIEFEDARLASGVYLYSLLVDNVVVDSKRMSLKK